MARLIHIQSARPSGAVHWTRVAAVMLAAALMGGGLAAWLAPGRDAPLRPEAFASASPARAAEPLRAVSSTGAAAAAAQPATDAVSCPIQSVRIAVAGAPPQVVCVGTTRVRQLGSVRTYEVQAGGVEGWVLQVDVAGGELVKAGLAARDGRRYTCEAAQCSGLSLGRHDTRGVRSVTLEGLVMARAAAAADPADSTAQTAQVSGRLSVPSDDQVPGLACTGPSVSISAPDGSMQKFCGQGGAGFEVADDGSRHYRFQDHEGQTLTVSVAPDQRVSSVQFGAFACRGSACGGASTNTAQPGNDMAERSFYFGRTPLGDATAPARSTPALIVDGTLVMPAQE